MTQNDAISRSAVLKIIDKHIDMAGDDDQMHYAMCVVAEGIKELPALDAAPDLNTLCDAIYEDACAHGLWDDDLSYPLDDCCELINDELKELAEAADDYEYKDSDMSGFIEELADVIIMSLSVACKLGIDIDAAVRRKMEINKNRPWRHEGEK